VIDEYNFCMLIWLNSMFDSESLVEQFGEFLSFHAGMPISEFIFSQCFRYSSKDHVDSTHKVKYSCNNSVSSSS